MSEAVAWLRKQIEGDKSAALIISCGGFAPERWDTDPPGQINLERMPEAHAIDRLLTNAEEGDPAFRPHGYWAALHSWDRENHEPESARVRESDLPVAIVNDGRREADHIRRQDPFNTVARCEAELAIVDLCERVIRDDEGEQLWSDGWAGLGVAKLNLAAVASGYRHRPGYAEHWGETAPTN
jgi:Family of unknown function (DUF6221)